MGRRSDHAGDRQRSQVQALANSELGKPTEANDQLKLADGWWDQAEADTDKPDEQRRLQAHALIWYEQALPSLKGLAKEKVEKRLTDAARLPKGVVLAFAFEKDDFTKRTGHVYVRDHSGNGNTGEVIAGAPAPGKVGGGLAFDGKHTYVQIPYSPSLKLDTFTISLWVKFRVPDGGQVLMTNHDSVKEWLDTFGWARQEFKSKTNDRYRGLTQDGGEQWKPSVGDWHHIVSRWDGQRVVIFADNSLVSKTRDISDTIKASEQPLLIGHEDGTFSRYLDGAIDELAIFNRALSDAEIGTVYRMGQRGKSVGK